MKRPDASSITTPQAPTTTATPQRRLHAGVDWLNTTWRIAVPVLLGTIIGITLDKRLDAAPWLTLLGVVGGFIVAGKLVSTLLAEAEDDA